MHHAPGRVETAREGDVPQLLVRQIVERLFEGSKHLDEFEAEHPNDACLSDVVLHPFHSMVRACTMLELAGCTDPLAASSRPHRIETERAPSTPSPSSPMEGGLERHR